MDRRSFLASGLLTASAIVTIPPSAFGRWIRRNCRGQWCPTPGNQCVPGSIFLSEAMKPERDPNPDGEDQALEASNWSVRWRGDFRKNLGEMTDHHKVSIYQGISDGGTWGRVSGKTYGHCKNLRSPVRLKFGFLASMAPLNPSGHITPTSEFPIAELDFGESKAQPYRVHRRENYQQYINWYWYMMIANW